MNTRYFYGRLNRLSYLAAYAASSAVWLLIGGIALFPDASPISIVLGLLYLVPYLLYMAVVMKQRANDASERHALLLAFVMFLVPLAWVTGVLLPSEAKKNKYGKRPARGMHLPQLFE